MYIFPTFLRGPLTASLSSVQEAGFIASQPAAGPYFRQIITDDNPVYFNLRFAFEGQKNWAFDAWLRQNNNDIRHGAQFEINIPIEDGLVTQTASFTPDGIPQRTSYEANIIFYQARIMVPRLNIPSAGFEDLILGVVESGGIYQLQYLINNDLPEA